MLALSGSNFVAGTVVKVNGSPRTTTYNYTQVDVQLTAADLAAAGTLNLTAVNPAPGGGTSNTIVVNVSSGFPGPLTFTPSAAVLGTPTPTTITINGSNFVPASQVSVGGAARASTYVSATQLKFTLTVADQAAAGTLYVYVVNPGSNGGSTYATLPVAAAAGTPAITSVSPTSFTAGAGASSISVFGSGFNAASQVLWNGTPLSGTYFQSTNYLYATLPASLLAAPGNASITVNNPTASTPLSNTVQVAIASPPAPTLTSIAPLSGPVNTAFTATLNGTGFTAASIVSINGIALPTTFFSATQVTAAVPALDVVPGNENFVVTTPAPGGGSSAAMVYTAYIPIVNNSMVFNPANQLFYLSIPSSAGQPYGNSVVSLDPLTGALGTPIAVGSEPDLMALSSDGSTLWVALDGAGTVRPINLATGSAGQAFALPGALISGSALKATALATLPGQPNAIVVASGVLNATSSTVAIFDSGALRGSAANVFSFNPVEALQTNGATGEIYAASSGSYRIYTYTSSGLTLKSTFNESGGARQLPGGHDRGGQRAALRR